MDRGVFLKSLFLCWFFAVLLPGAAQATASAAVPSEEDVFQADMVARMRSDSPPERVVQLLRAVELSREAQFTLAGLEPVLVEQATNPRTLLVLDYISVLPATELSELRSGQTVVRTEAGWSKAERLRLEAIAEEWGIKKHKKLLSVRIGNMSGRSMRFELVGKKGDMSLEFAGASTPEREERARSKLTAHFGARPPEITSGPGTRLPLLDGSFEDPKNLGTTWELVRMVERGSMLPAAEVTLDRDMVLDGHSSLRFHSDSNTRYWSALQQRISIAPSTSLVLHGLVKAHHVQLERDQERHFNVALEFEDVTGAQVGERVLTRIDQGDFDWREVVVRAVAPPDADYVKVVVVCTLSGTAWFDGLSLEIGY